MDIARLTLPPLGLYLHLPWCVQKCPYCDFNSHALRGELPEKEYTAAILKDIPIEAERTNGRPLASIFIGGGTPSLFSASAIGHLLEQLEKQIPFANDIEITLEANPGTTEATRFRGFLAAGVNRLSIGVQSFNSAHLQSLGRIHDGDAAIHAIKTAQSVGFKRINVDLMHGLPNQTLAAGLADVEQALALGVTHLSHYQLTLEPGTAFFNRPPQLPDDDERADIEAACAERIAESGLERYEISAWSTPDQACRHNLNYWEFGDYLALGAGAHGKVSQPDGSICRYQRVRLPRLYQSLAGTPEAIAETHEVSPDQRPLEYLMNALRLTHGTSLDAAITRTGLSAAAFEPGLSIARDNGWLDPNPNWLKPTPLGSRFLDDLLALFVVEPQT